MESRNLNVRYEHICDVLDKRAKDTPNEEAHVVWMQDAGDQYHREGITYRALYEKSIQLADALVNNSSGEGHRLLFLGSISPGLLYLYHAAIRIGTYVIWLPDSDVTGSRISSILTKYKINLLISDDDYDHVIATDEAGASYAKDRLDTFQRKYGRCKYTLSVEELVQCDALSTEHDLVISSRNIQRDPSRSYMASTTVTNRMHDPDEPVVTVTVLDDDQDLQFALYSSFAIVNNIHALYSSIGASRGQKHFSGTSASVEAVFLPVCYGVTTIHVHHAIADHLTPLWSIISSEQINTARVTEKILVESLEFETLGEISVPSSLASIIVSNVRMDHIFRKEQLGRAAVYSSYDLRESLPFTVNMLRKVSGSLSPGILPHVEVLVTDERGDKCPAGVPGRLSIKSPFAFSRYLHDTSTTSKNNVWIETSYSAVVEQDNSFVVIGRNADVIRRGNQYVYPYRIENVIKEFSPIQQVVVLGMPNHGKTQAIWAFVSLRHGVRNTVTVCDVYQYIQNVCMQGHLYNAPTRVVVMEYIPTNFNGSVNRYAILKCIATRNLDVKIY